MRYTTSIARDAPSGLANASIQYPSSGQSEKAKEQANRLDNQFRKNHTFVQSLI
jgi:hypothetical protein